MKENAEPGTVDALRTRAASGFVQQARRGGSVAPTSWLHRLNSQRSKRPPYHEGLAGGCSNARLLPRSAVSLQLWGSGTFSLTCAVTAEPLRKAFLPEPDSRNLCLDQGRVILLLTNSLCPAKAFRAVTYFKQHF